LCTTSFVENTYGHNTYLTITVLLIKLSSVLKGSLQNLCLYTVAVPSKLHDM